MCGPSQAETNLSNAQAQMYQTLTNNYNTTFPQQQEITGALTSAFTPILNAGIGQEGFTPSEKNALETQNAENVATNYAQAQKAAAEALAGRGGGNTFLPSGVATNILAQNTNAAAAMRSATQNQNTLADYAQGRQNFLSAAGALAGDAGIINPLGYASASTNAGQAAFSSASTMATQSNSIWNAAIGALGGLGGAALGNSTLMNRLLPSASTATPSVNTSGGYGSYGDFGA